MSESSQVQQIAKTATKADRREIFKSSHGLEVVKLKRKFINPQDFVKRSASTGDFSLLIKKSTIAVDADTGEIIFVYKLLELDPAKVIRALQRIRYEVSTRTRGVKTTSRTFGYLPRNPLRRDFCSTTSLAIESPADHAAVCQYGIAISQLYSEFTPKTYEKHQQIMKAKVLDEWAIRQTPFTSGIINKNNPLKYHFDAGNFRGMYSCMVGFKKDVGGGFLALPDYDVGVEIASNSVFMFDGQEILHGVTPISRLSAQAFRYTIVYYSLQQIWKCLPLDGELARIRKIKTEREEKRLRIMQGKEAQPKSIQYVLGHREKRRNSDGKLKRKADET